MPVSHRGAHLPHIAPLATTSASRRIGCLYTLGEMETVHMTRDERYAAAEKLKDDGDLAGAVAAMEALVADEPAFALAHSALGAWCTRLERHADAVRHARRACELEPQDPFSYTALSVACMRAGMIPEAEEALARARMMQGG